MIIFKFELKMGHVCRLWAQSSTNEIEAANSSNIRNRNLLLMLLFALHN